MRRKFFDHEEKRERGRWGNADVEVRFEKLEELPYVMGIIRQALERQLGDEAGAE